MRLTQVIKNYITQLPSLVNYLQQRLAWVYLCWFLAIALIFSLGLTADGLLPGYSAAENEVLKITQSLVDPLKHFLYWPYYLSVYLLRLVIEDGVLAARLLSASLGIVAAGCFLFLLRQRFSVFISLIGASLLACNSWFLSLARSGVAEISLLSGFLVLVSCLILLKRHLNKTYLSWVALIVFAGCWFLPLMPWLLIWLVLYSLFKKEEIWQRLSLIWRFSLIVLLICLIGLTIFSLNQTQAVVLTSWGIPDSLVTPWQFLQNLKEVLAALVWRAPDNPALWLGNLPFLDIFLIAMLPFGIYATYLYLKQKRQRKLISVFFILCFFAAINQGITTPGVFLLLLLTIWLVVAGLNHLLQHWRSFFPANPLAKAIGLTIFLVLIGFSLFYQVKKYFVAWSNQPQIQQIYNLKHSKD